MPQIYAIALEKGGVGKTSIAVNLAAAYAHVGMRTLLIDLDAQRHASRWLGVDTERLPVEHSFAGVALGHRPLHECVVSTAEGVDVIPAHKDMVALPELLGKEMGAGIYLLRDTLEQAGKDGYRPEVVIFDLAPARGPVLATALTAATRCIAPAQAVDLVLQSLRDMVETVNRARAFNPSLRGLSVLRNNYTPRAALDKVYDDGLSEAYAGSLLQTVIPSRALIRLCSGARQSVFAFRGPDDTAVREIFLALVEELLNLDGVPS
jgi:chromosome partitioning protein